MNDCECRGCTARHVGCHAECSRYADFKKRREAEKQYGSGDYEARAMLSVGYITRQRRANVRGMKYKVFGGGAKG